MTLALRSTPNGRSYPELGHGYPELGRSCQELPIDLSRRRSPSPDVSISLGPNTLLDRTMGPPPDEPSAVPQDLRVRPSHSIIPFHKLRRHSQKSGGRTRLKKQRLEEAVTLLREREARDSSAGSAGWLERTQDVGDDNSVAAKSPAPAPTPPPLPHQMMQQILLMQQTDAHAYPSLFYLQYCAMMQSLQLQQALQRQQAAKQPPAATSVSQHRPDSPMSAASTAATPPATPSTPSTPEEPPLRRRAPRTLTGKHVRQGQGASPETLRTLRRVLLEKARLRELGLLPPPKAKPKGRRKK